MRQYVYQGFPILIHDTRPRENQSESLFKVSIKVAHLWCDMANPCAIHQAQDGAIELSEQSGYRPSASVTGIFP